MNTNNKPEPKKVQIRALLVPEETHKKLTDDAKREMRTITAQASFALQKYYESNTAA